MPCPFRSYALGFILGASPKQFKHGLVEWMLLLLVHLSFIPIYTIMETWGVARGILDRSTYTGFHIVQKEKTPSAVPPTETEEVREITTEESVKIPASPQATPAKIEMPLNTRDTINSRKENLEYWTKVMNIDYDHLDLVRGSPFHLQQASKFDRFRSGVAAPYLRNYFTADLSYPSL